METIHSKNLDAIGATVFFARSLEYHKSRMYDILYPEYKAIAMIPVSTEAGSAAKTIVYSQYDSVGYMKIISSYADDLPRSDVVGREFSSIVKSLGGSYGWNIQEVRSAQLANVPLPSMKAMSARKSYDQSVNKIGWFGDPTNELLGFLNQPNVPAGAIQTGVTSGNTKWLGAAPKTNLEVLKDLNDIVIEPTLTTKGIEISDTILLPLPELGHIRSTKLADGTDTTILQFFLNNHPGVTVDWVNELGEVALPPSGASGPLNVMISYRRSPDKLTFELPQLFEQFPVQDVGLEFLVPTHARIGGVIVYYPLSIAIREGF